MSVPLLTISAFWHPLPCQHSQASHSITTKPPSHWGKLFSLSESGTFVLLITSAASAPWCPSHASAGMLHTKSQSLSQDHEIWRVLTTTDVGNATQRQRFRFNKSTTHQWCVSCPGILPLIFETFCAMCQHQWNVDKVTAPWLLLRVNWILQANRVTAPFWGRLNPPYASTWVALTVCVGGGGGGGMGEGVLTGPLVFKNPPPVIATSLTRPFLLDPRLLELIGPCKIWGMLILVASGGPLGNNGAYT